LYLAAGLKVSAAAKERRNFDKIIKRAAISTGEASII
jgi:hypothetical protein